MIIKIPNNLSKSLPILRVGQHGGPDDQLLDGYDGNDAFGGIFSETMWPISF